MPGDAACGPAMPTFHQLFVALAFLAALGSGLIAGVFFAFSSFVMKALSRRPADQGLAAMQAINIAVINPLFLGVFLGTALLCIAVTAVAFSRWWAPGAAYAVAGAALYLLGSFVVTMLCNVPLNNALAKLTASDPAAAEQWSHYVRRWTAWNHVRTVTALAAAALLSIAMRH